MAALLHSLVCCHRYNCFENHKLHIQLFWAPQIAYTTVLRTTNCKYNCFEDHKLQIQLFWLPQIADTTVLTMINHRCNCFDYHKLQIQLFWQSQIADTTVLTTTNLGHSNNIIYLHFQTILVLRSIFNVFRMIQHGPPPPPPSLTFAIFNAPVKVNPGGGAPQHGSHRTARTGRFGKNTNIASRPGECRE